MDNGKRIFEDVHKHLSSLRKCKSDAHREEQRALADSRRSLEISRETESLRMKVKETAMKKLAAIEEEYQAKKASVERIYLEKKVEGGCCYIGATG